MRYEPTLHKLSNGITVILDPMDLETTTIKICVKGGTRIEQPSEYGISHFIEHMLFAGTEKRPGAKLGRDLISDNGGTRGGATGLGYTEYYGRILSENFPVLLDVLSDMLLNSQFLSDDIEKEKKVVIQEINRSQDDQARQFNGLVKTNLFSGSYLERYDGLGTIETLSSFNRDNLLTYMKNKYTSDNIIIGISGKINSAEQLLKDLESLFQKIELSDEVVELSRYLNPSVVYDVRNDKKQTKMFIGFENGYPDERKYDYESMCLGVFVSALGRRLYEDIRDKQGLVYGFGGTGYGDRYLGVNGFMTALSPEKLSDVIASIAKGSYDILYRSPVTLEELNRRNNMVKLGRADFFESSSKRCDKLINFYKDYSDLYDPKEFDDMRAKITTDDVMKYSANYFSSPVNIIAQGPACDIDMKAIWEDSFK